MQPHPDEDPPRPATANGPVSCRPTRTRCGRGLACASIDAPSGRRAVARVMTTRSRKATPLYSVKCGGEAARMQARVCQGDVVMAGGVGACARMERARPDAPVVAQIKPRMRVARRYARSAFPGYLPPAPGGESLRDTPPYAKSIPCGMFSTPPTTQSRPAPPPAASSTPRSLRRCRPRSAGTCARRTGRGCARWWGCNASSRAR